MTPSRSSTCDVIVAGAVRSGERAAAEVLACLQ